MSDILILAANFIQADGALHAESIFDQINGLANDSGETAKTIFGAGFIVGAVITWIKNKFSVQSAIVGLLLVGVGLAILSQLDVVKKTFEDTIAAPTTVNEAPAFQAQDDLDGPVVITIDDLPGAA